MAISYASSLVLLLFSSSHVLYLLWVSSSSSLQVFSSLDPDMTWIFNSEDKNQTYQNILTPDRVKVWVKEVKEGLFEQVHTTNKTDKLCNEYREVIANNAVKLHSRNLHKCWVIDSALFKNNLLWVSESLQTELLQKIHD